MHCHHLCQSKIHWGQKTHDPWCPLYYELDRVYDQPHESLLRDLRKSSCSDMESWNHLITKNTNNWKCYLTSLRCHQTSKIYYEWKKYRNKYKYVIRPNSSICVFFITKIIKFTSIKFRFRFKQISLKRFSSVTQFLFYRGRNVLLVNLPITAKLYTVLNNWKDVLYN